MKKNKNLQSGFTLVELIVVVALMAIVFGALMNVLKPTNIFFNESEAFKDEVMISAGLTDALGDEVRYSTNVIVLQNYVGVPSLVSGKQFSGLPDVEFDSAIMFDNDNVRGSAYSDYTPDGTVASRKGAKGQIVKFALNELGVDFGSASSLYNLDYYADYQYEFTATGNIDENNMAYVDFGITMYDYSAAQANYDYDEMPYESSEYLYLKNINLRDDDGYKMYVKDFGGSVEDSDYAGFERASADASFTSEQQKYYDKSNSSNVHTFIFYYKGVTVTPLQNVNLTFDPGTGGSTVMSYTALKGRQCRVTPPAVPEAGYESETVNGVVFSKTFSGWKSNVTGNIYTADEIYNYVASADETFTAQYILAGATFDVSFYNSLGTQIGLTQTVDYAGAVSPPTVEVPAGYDGYVWKFKGSDKDVIDDSEFASVTRNIEAEPYFYKNCTITYYDEDGTTVLNTETVMSGLNASTFEVPEKTGYIGEWEVHGTDDAGNPIVTPFSPINVTSDLTVVAKYTENTPTGYLTVTHSLTNLWSSTAGQLGFDITNSGTEVITSGTIRIKITDGTVSNISNYWGNLRYTYNATAQAIGGDIVISFSSVEIQPGATGNITLQLSGTNLSDTFESITITAN